MTTLKKLAAALAAVVLASGAAQATPLTEWTFNPTGQGVESGQYVLEYLDVNGMAFFQVAGAGGQAVTIREHAAFNIVQADSNGQLFPVNYPGTTITGIYEATGIGELGGSFRYTAGNLRLYQNSGFPYGSSAGIYGANVGKLIGNVRIDAGGGRIDASGNVEQRGTNTIMARIARGDLESGYFFSGDGRDLAGVANLQFVLPTAHTIGIAGPVTVPELACEFAAFTGPGCNGGIYSNVSGEHYLLSLNGQLRLVDLPEPGSLALFGVALFAAAAAGRRRVQ